jgi:hypothetical protein
MSDARVAEMAKAIVEDGAMPGEQRTNLAVLARARSSLVLPILETKIEEVHRSENPASCFRDKSVNPQQVVEGLLYTIANVGNEAALRQAVRLLRLDEKRFDKIVGLIMASAMAGDREFMVVYQGLDLSDAAVTKRLVRWADDALSEELPLVGNSRYDSVRGMRWKWAEVLVERYGAAPTPQQWDSDSLVSRLRPAIRDKLYYDVHRFAVDEAVRRGPAK